MGRPNLRLRGEVRKLFRSGKIYRGSWMHVRAGESDLNRTLISVRKKFGSAVLRNRARRRIRVLCRELNPCEHSGRLLLISLGDRARNAGYRCLRRDLQSAFETLGLLDP